MDKRKVWAWAPASVSNLGPGFDALGAALSGMGDTVGVAARTEPGITVSWHLESVWTGPDATESNTAAVAASHVARQYGYEGGLDITIRKGLMAGTGLGSSAASSVAAAVAADSVLGGQLGMNGMASAVIHGESVVSGAGHGDNVLPSLLGGFVLLRSRHPVDHIRLEAWSELGVIILMPDMSIMTKEARAVLPASVTVSETVDHAARLALLVDSLHRRDIEALGYWMMSDTLIEEAREDLLPHLAPVREAALKAGAAGCTVSGSGPAIMAIHDTRIGSGATHIAKAMEEACNAMNLTGRTTHHQISNAGACIKKGDQAIAWRDAGVSEWVSTGS